MDTSEKKSDKVKILKENGSKCPECKENTLKTEVIEWGGLTQYIYRYCLNCGFEEKTIESLY